MKEKLLLHVPSMHCAGCIRKIESQLQENHAVFKIHSNLADKVVSVEFDSHSISYEGLRNQLEKCGYNSFVINPDKYHAELHSAHKKELQELLIALAVAGFASGNIMLLSVSIWGGADEITARLFHLISALIATPVVFYCGRIFFRQAWRSIIANSWGMDVPISIAVILAYAKSMYELWIGGGQTWFDASVMLLFFLLIGRTLDVSLRQKSRHAANLLLSYLHAPIQIINKDGSLSSKNATDVKLNEQVLVKTGERLAVDGLLLNQKAYIDSSALTGESLPHTYQQAEQLHAGFINMGEDIQLSVNALAHQTLPAQLATMTEQASATKGQYAQIADTVVKIYVPTVHSLALATFIIWLAITHSLGTSIDRAIAVLIITCPCALGLAQPLVQACAAMQFLKHGLLAKSGSAFEKLASINAVVFDKTGTLTNLMPQNNDINALTPKLKIIAFALAQHSHHPLSKALQAKLTKQCLTQAQKLKISNIHEIPAHGISATINNKKYSLGKIQNKNNQIQNNQIQNNNNPKQYLTTPTGKIYTITYSETIKENAPNVIQQLQNQGLTISIISGDKINPVKKIANKLNVKQFTANASPKQKLKIIQNLQQQNIPTAMIGDGINDAPALSAAHISMSPSSASELAQAKADIVWLGDNCKSIATAYSIAKKAKQLLKSNFALAALYNVIALPIAALGYAGPLVAAIAMSTSSIIVSVNAMRIFINTHKQ